MVSKVESYIPMQEKFEELKTVLENIKKNDNILIIADNDGDGIPAAAIFAKILRKLGFEYKKDFQVIFVDHDFRGLIKNNIEKQKYLQTFKYIFLLDFSLNDYSFLKNTFIGVIDHHKINEDCKLESFDLIINPMYHDEMKSKENCCACALVYCAYRFMFGKDEILEKIAFASSMSDWFPIGSLIYLGIEKNNSEYFVNGGYIVPSNNILNTICFQLTDPEFGSLWAFEKLFLETDKDLQSIILLPEKFYKKLNKQNERVNKALNRIFRNIFRVEDLIFLELREKDKKYKLNINVNLQVVYPGTTTFLAFENKKEKGYNISSRSQIIDLVVLGNFAKQTCKTLVGGGHSVAAGFFIKKSEFAKYKKLIIENYNNFKK